MKNICERLTLGLHKPKFSWKIFENCIKFILNNPRWSSHSGYTQAKGFLEKLKSFLEKLKIGSNSHQNTNGEVCIMSNFNYLIASLMQLDFIESAPARILWNFNKLLHQLWSSDSPWSVQIRRYFWFVFSCIRTEYGDLSYFWSVFSCIQTDLLCKSPYSIRMQENMDQK